MAGLRGGAPLLVDLGVDGLTEARHGDEGAEVGHLASGDDREQGVGPGVSTAPATPPMNSRRFQR